MSASLITVLERIEAALREAVVAGTAHAAHSLDEAAGYAHALERVGMHALAAQLAALAHPDPQVRTRALAEALRSVSLTMVYLLGTDEADLEDGVGWPDDRVVLEPVETLAAALDSSSDVVWAWALDHFRGALDGQVAMLVEAARAGRVTARRRAIEALSYVPTQEALDCLLGLLGEVYVGRVVVQGLLRLAEDEALDVVRPLVVLLQPDAGDFSPKADHAALVLYRMGAYNDLFRHHGHSRRFVRCYAEMAAVPDGVPLRSRLPDDPAAQLIVRSAAADRLGEADPGLLRDLLGMQKQSLPELCFHLADTPTGWRLLEAARDSVPGRTPRGRSQRACLVLGMLGDARDVPRLMGKSMRGLAEAYQGLGMMGGETVFRYLCDVVDGNVPNGQVGPAMLALGALGDERAVPRLLALLNTNSLHTRAAASALAAVRAQEAVPYLIDRLAKAQPFEMNVYAEALIQIDDPAAVKGFVDALTKQPSRMAASRRVLVRGLTGFGEESIDAMTDLLEHDNSRLRAVAEEVLSSIDTERSRAVLKAYLEADPLQYLLTRLTYGSPEVRRKAQHELNAMSGVELAGLLETAFGTDAGEVSPHEAKALLKAVADLHFPEVVEPLRGLISTGNAVLAKSALTTLTSFPYVVNRPTLMTRLDANRLTDARQAANALGQQDMSVVDEVLDHLASGNPNTRAGALTVLGKKRARWVMDRVMPLFDDPHPRVQAALASNVAQLSVPALEEEIVTRLVAQLDSAPLARVGGLVGALQVMACGTGREDAHLALVDVWRRGTRRGNQVLEAVGAVGHPDARKLLALQLGSSKVATVQSAIQSLARLGDSDALSLLEGVFEEATTSSLFRALHEGLARLSRGWHRLYRAQAALTRGNAIVALSEAEAYVADNPEAGEGYFERARAHHAAGNLSAAYEDYLQAGRKQDRHQWSWFGAGWVAHQLGDLGAAVEHYDMALKLGRDNGKVRLRRGFLLLEQGQIQDALEDFKLTVRSRTGPSSLHQRVAGTMADIVRLIVDVTQPPSRVQLLGLMDRPLPNRMADTVLIWALILVGRYAEARQCLDRFARRWPDARPYTLLNTAWLYAAAGEMTPAREAVYDLKDYAHQKGYFWPNFVRYGFSDWPIVCEPLTRLLLDEIRGE